VKGGQMEELKDLETGLYKRNFFDEELRTAQQKERNRFWYNRGIG